MTSFKEFLEEQLLDEQFATEYEEVSGEMDLALALVLRREKLGLTQQQLAATAGMKQPMIARIENGQMPSPRTLQRLAKALKVGVLFTGDGFMLLPMTGSKNVAASAHLSFEASHGKEWQFPLHKVARKRQKVECDYTLLARMVEPTISEGPRQKEKANGSLEVAA